MTTLQRLSLSALSGLLLVLALPNFSLTFLGWVALAPLLLALERAPSARAAALAGFASGFIFFAGTIYWIRSVMLDYGGMGQVAATAVHVAFMAALALFFVVFAVAAWLLLRRLPDAHILWGVPALWVATELLRAHIFTGFPWLLLGYVPADHLLIAQLARFGGVYLLSFLVVFSSTGIVLVARRPTPGRGRVLALGLVGLAAATAGARLLPDPPAPEAAYLVQAQVKMEEDWTQDSFQALLSDLVKGTIAAYARNESRSGLVVWPEMPAPLYADDRELRAHLRRLATATQSRMVVNAVAFADSERQRVYNSALLVDAAGEFRGRYDKIQLVPFGEYIPMKRLFFFMEKITTEVGDFHPGTVARPLGDPGPQPPLGALVCYENVFPDLVRKITAGGAAVLLNLSNDGWYGQSAARDQLLLMSRLRAVENGRWLLRATNTGITAVIDPYGRVRVFPPDRRAVYAARFGYRTERTVFVAFGHWFSALAAAAAVALVFRAWRANRIEERQP